MTTIVIILIAASILIACYFAGKAREKSIREFRRRHVSTYVIKNLNQHTFTKAVNIVQDLVARDGADIEVIYNDEVIFNGYVGYDGELHGTPHFWYNKKVLDENGIEY